MSTSRGPTAIVNPTIFREYIGMKPYPDNLTDFPGVIINPNIPEFHFILGFATEGYDNNGRGTGDFKPTWNYDYFGAEKIKQLKHNHGNVKVLISIGGVGAEYPFNPAEREVWHINAIASLRKIIDGYKNDCSCDNLIDGIDINYEVIKSNDFAHCIGKVISGLKKDGLIKVVSIAPSDQVRSYYRRLYVEHGNDIDWVNYKFYNQTVPSTDKFKKLYRELSSDYHAKLLAGFSTDPDVNGITREVFIEGCIDLLNSKLLPGIFVWNANDSAANPTSNEEPFSLEDIAQKLLTKSA